MKKQITFLLSIFIAILTNAQTYKVDLEATLNDDYKKMKEGTKVTISQVINNVYLDEYDNLKNEYLFVIGNDTIKYDSRISNRLDFTCNNIQDLWNQKIICNVFDNLEDKGVQKALRSELEDEALSYINKQKEYGMVFNDPYLENYIYSLVSRIAPKTLIDGRPGNVNLLILENPTMNASMYSNGTLVINTGLLSALHTEDELVAILAHEIAHFVLDHNIWNVNAAVARKKKAEFWAALATGLTAVAEGVAAVKSNYYMPGGATLGMAVLSSSIAQQVVDRLGMKYNAEQEIEADNTAVQALEILGYDRNALATALNRMKDIMVQERSNVMYFQSYTHPALMKRILETGRPQDVANQKFEQIISFAVTSTARMKFEDRRFRQVLPLVNQNIANDVATAEDYILKAHSLLALHGDAQTNLEVLEMINIAKSLDETDINIYKAEILANLRAEKYNISQELLEQYLQRLNEMELSLKGIESDRIWENTYQFIVTERDWAKRMAIKLKTMQ